MANESRTRTVELATSLGGFSHEFFVGPRGSDQRPDLAARHGGARLGVHTRERVGLCGVWIGHLSMRAGFTQVPSPDQHCFLTWMTYSNLES